MHRFPREYTKVKIVIWKIVYDKNKAHNYEVSINNYENYEHEKLDYHKAPIFKLNEILN